MSAREETATAPLVTVIVPVLDGAATLRLCLDSIVRSNFTDWELIVVDDGSQDDSPEIAVRSGATVLHTTERQGPGSARNLGASRAKGEILFFIDADCSAAWSDVTA